MSPTSYQTAPPRGGLTTVPMGPPHYQPGWLPSPHAVAPEASAAGRRRSGGGAGAAGGAGAGGAGGPRPAARQPDRPPGAPPRRRRLPRVGHGLGGGRLTPARPTSYADPDPGLVVVGDGGGDAPLGSFALSWA